MQIASFCVTFRPPICGDLCDYLASSTIFEKRKEEVFEVKRVSWFSLQFL
jgi:hypothetical protein